MKRFSLRSILLVLSLAFVAIACGGGHSGATVFEFESAGLEFPVIGVAPTPDPPTDPSQPEPQVTLSPAFIDAVEVTAGAGSGEISVGGHLPTPCHRLRWEVGEPGPDAVIHLNVGSEADAGQICIQVTEPFSDTMEIANLGEGHYTLVVAGKKLGELAPAANPGR